MEERIKELVDGFHRYFGGGEPDIYSAPGRTELGGNHTDHQHGLVLAGAVDADMLAACGKNGGNIVSIKSQGYDMFSITLNDLSPRAQELGTSQGLVRGICSEISKRGYELGGFDAYISSAVMKGSGLSSSAAFEVLIGAVINGLFCGDELNATDLAIIGQRAENVYFGKPCGLMDQMASAWGGVVAIDFKEPSSPTIEKLDFDLAATGYALCLVDVGADHENLTDEYAAIPAELEKISEYFGAQVLRDVDENAFYGSIKELRAVAGDRAVLRAIHVFEENKRVEKMKNALKSNDFNTFLELVKQSGASSWMYLQNVSVPGSTAEQSAALALALCQKLLGSSGAWRIHGGGFGGTVQAFVPQEQLPDFKARMEAVFGDGRCHVMQLRNDGFKRIEI
jgi:galactokinase